MISLKNSIRNSFIKELKNVDSKKITDNFLVRRTQELILLVKKLKKECH